MVPGSTLIYGSSFSMVTRRPRDSRMAASEAAAMPLPREETTPPVTNTYLVIVNLHARGNRAGAGNLDYSPFKWGKCAQATILLHYPGPVATGARAPAHDKHSAMCAQPRSI